MFLLVPAHPGFPGQIPQSRETVVCVLGIDDIISVLQQNRLQWYGHVLQKEDNDWVKKCTQYEVEGARPRGRPKKNLERDCGKRLLGTWIEQGGCHGSY